MKLTTNLVVRSVALCLATGLTCYMVCLCLNREKGSIKGKLEPTNWIVNIFYATQSGTSRKYAQSFRDRLCIAYSDVEVYLVDLDMHDPVSEPIWNDPESAGYVRNQNAINVFMLSTYGDGCPPDGCNKLLPYLKKKKVSNMKSMILGLGNSTYHSNFCKFASDSTKLLRKGGANLLFSGNIDESGDQDGDYEKWCLEALRCFNSIKLISTTPKGAVRIPPKTMEVDIKSKLRSMLEVCHVTKLYDGNKGGLAFHELRCRTVSKRESDISMKDSIFHTISITPFNNATEVQLLLELMDLDGEERCPIVKGANITNREFLTSNVDIQFPYNHDYYSFSIIMALILRSLPYSEDATGMLNVFESNLVGNADIIASEIVKEVDMQYQEDETSLSDVICHLFDTLTPINYNRVLSREVSYDILARLPQIKPRLYSVSNFDDDIVELCVTNVIRERNRKGLCSAYIGQQLVRGTLLPTTFTSCPTGVIENWSPILFVYTGSGVAPLRRLVQIIEKKSLNIELYVIGGCRYYPDDILYENDISKHATLYKIASSRTQANDIIDGNKFIYHGCYTDVIIAKLEKEVIKRIQATGMVFACGSQANVKGVKQAISKLCKLYEIPEIQVRTEN